MKYQDRVVRVMAALAIAGIVAIQIPMQGGTAMGSVPLPGKPQVPADGYISADSDNSGRFLGIKGLTNRKVISAVGLGLVGYGIYSTVADAQAASSAAGLGKAVSNTATTPNGPAVGSKSIYDVAHDTPGDFSELVTLIDDAEMVRPLREKGPYTFFAPSNTGLKKLTPDQLTALRRPENKTNLARLIQHHTVVGRYTISDLLKLKDSATLETLAGTKIRVTKSDKVLMVDGVAVVQNDIAASNGWIHPIEAALPQP